MKFSTWLHKKFADYFWNMLPGLYQKVISDLLAKVYSTSLSKFMIAPFTRRYKMSDDELLKYAPASGFNKYNNFQDFFTRRLVSPLNPVHRSIFPCEGLVCDSGVVADLGAVKVKGHTFDVRKIFASLGDKIPDSHFFYNIFLHNHNYHRFHAPVSGVIKSIENVPGQLNLLRPWLYAKAQVSEPAFLNERVVLEISDEDHQSWFVTFVGGMSVGKISLHETVKPGASLNCGDEIGLFLLGSTCCIAAPVKSSKYKFLTKVKVGDPMSQS